MRNAAFIYATGTLMLLGIALPARAQYVNLYTGNNWNNPNSSLLDTAILGMRNRMMLSNALASSRVSAASLRAAYTRQVNLGQSRIKSGKATTRFTRGTFPTDYWVKQCGGTTPEKRKQCLAEFAVQKELWAQEARNRNADTNDMAQALGLAFVLAWEGQTGEKPTAAQYKGITQDFRTMLLKDALYQGMSASDRQTYFEGQMINATDSVRLLREGQQTGDTATLQKAHDSGKKYTNIWLPRGYTRYVATSTGFQETK